VSRGHTVVLRAGWLVNGERVEIAFRADPCRTGYPKDWAMTGRSRIDIRLHDTKKSFFIKKDGSIDADAIIERVLMCVSQTRDLRTKANAQATSERANFQIVQKLVKELYDPADVEVRQDYIGNEIVPVMKAPKVPVLLKAVAGGLNIELPFLNEEQARVILKACKAVGLLGGRE
jgi:hypothetical protein